MRILVTGNKGFIGKNIASYLQQQGHEVEGWEWQPGILPSTEDYDWCIHLGAISSTTYTDVNQILEQNFEFTLKLAQVCENFGTNLQYASSASVYGTNTEFNEDAPKLPQSYYATSKYLFDRWVMQQSHNIIVQGFRFFNVYGPGEDHKGDQASPVTKFFKQAREKGVITLFENSDKYLRDFIYVGDCCNIHRFMLTSSESGIFNIGTGVATSFQTIAELISKRFNAKIEYVPMPNSLNGQYQEYTCADIDQLRKLVNINFTTPEDFINGSN